MKKILVLVLVLAMLFTLVGCAKEEVATPAEEKATEVVVKGDTLADAATAYFADLDGNNIVAWADMFAIVEAGDEPYILSIRSADDYAKGHIEGAVNAAWGADLASKVSMLPKDEKVYVYCYSGQTAGQTIALLRMLGIDAVSVKSGFNKGAMVTEGYEDYVVTDAAEMVDAGADFDADVLSFVEEYFAAAVDAKNFMVDSAGALTLVDAGEATVVDIRKAEDFVMGSIEDAINVPYGAGMQETFAGLPQGKLIVACYSGQTAGQTVAVLRALGYDAVSLKYGMKLGYGPYVTKMAATEYFADFPGSRIVEWADLFAKIDAGEEPYILSIRSADDYAIGHIKGAKLAAWGNGEIAEKVAMLPTDETVYVYCYSGQTAGQTIAMMNMAGIDAVSVKSGFVKGAMTVDGYEAYVETDANELMDAGATFDPFVLSSVKAYFAAIPDGGSNIISVEDAKAAIDAGEVSVIDIRKADDFAAGHIEGAINVPYGANMQEKFADLPEGKLVVTCYSGQTAGQTVAVMKTLGYDAVSLKYGMKLGWVPAEMPVVTE